MARETNSELQQRNEMHLVRQATMAVASRTSRRQTERERFSSGQRTDHEEADSLHPIFDRRTWNVGKGRKCTQTGKDMLFMLLATVKSGGTWEFLAALFGFQAPTFEKMMTRFLSKIHQHVYELFVEDEVAVRTMSHLVATGKTFQNFPAALFAVDATFQQSNRPLGNHNEALFAFSGKHHLYGKK
ncbi:hypothetical protein H310_15303, partial [Aphanomyces invadans]